MNVNFGTNKEPWQKVAGFFTKAEGLFLQRLLRHCHLPQNHVVLEIGSLFGKSTCCLAMSKYRVVSIDPHEGIFQKVLHNEVMMTNIGSTYSQFLTNLKKCNADRKVEAICSKSEDVNWDGRPLAMLFIDGIHDKQHITQDFWRFQKFVSPGGYVTFHDYGSSFYPDVREFVDRRVLASAAMKKIYIVKGQEGSVFALKKLGNDEAAT